MAALAVPQWDGGGGGRRATAHCWDDVRRGMHKQTRTLALEATTAAVARMAAPSGSRVLEV